MTGFGAAEGPVAGGMIRVEIRTVNHRFFNCFNLAAKLPGGGAGVERGQQAANGPCCDFLVRATDPGTNRTATPHPSAAPVRGRIAGKQEARFDYGVPLIAFFLVQPKGGIASNCSRVIVQVESNA